MTKKFTLLFLSLMLLLGVFGFSNVSAKNNNKVETTYSEDEPTNASDYLMEDFLESLSETKDPKVKKDELGNLYTLQNDGSLEITINDSQTLQSLTNNEISIQCIACVGGVTITLTKSGSPYTTYGSWYIGVEGSYPINPISFSKTFSWSNSYSGDLQASTSALSATVGFNVTASGSSVATANLPLSKGQSGRIEYRYVYNNQKVTQTVKIGTTTSTNTIVTKKYSHVQYSSKVW